MRGKAGRSRKCRSQILCTFTLCSQFDNFRCPRVTIFPTTWRSCYSLPGRSVCRQAATEDNSGGAEWLLHLHLQEQQQQSHRELRLQLSFSFHSRSVFATFAFYSTTNTFSQHRFLSRTSWQRRQIKPKKRTRLFFLPLLSWRKKKTWLFLSQVSPGRHPTHSCSSPEEARNAIRASMFHWGKWKKRMGANSSSKRPVFDEKEDGEWWKSVKKPPANTSWLMCSSPLVKIDY